MSRSGFEYALTALGVAVAGDFDAGVLASIHAGLSAAAATHRELSDLEKLGLDNLISQLRPDAVSLEEAAKDELAPATEQGAEGDGLPSQGEVTQPDARVAAAAAAPAPSEPASAESLFQPQSHDEDDGA